MTKKILSLVLAFMLLISVSAFAAESKYYNMADTLIETVCGEDQCKDNTIWSHLPDLHSDIYGCLQSDTGGYSDSSAMQRSGTG